MFGEASAKGRLRVVPATTLRPTNWRTKLGMVAVVPPNAIQLMYRAPQSSAETDDVMTALNPLSLARALPGDAKGPNKPVMKLATREPPPVSCCTVSA